MFLSTGENTGIQLRIQILNCSYKTTRYKTAFLKPRIQSKEQDI